MLPRKLLHMNLIAAWSLCFYVFLVFGRMKKKAKTASLKSGVQPRLLPHSNLHHPVLLSLSYPSVSRAPSPSPSPAVTPHPCTDPCLLSFEACLFFFGRGKGGVVSFGFFFLWFQSLRFRRSTALKSAFLGCESIDGRDSSHSCAIFMLTSSEKVFLRACLTA
jgi:hypothetical protein